MPSSFLGVTVMTEYAQHEGVEAVLDSLSEAGLNAVTITPRVLEPSDAPDAFREPPIDAGEGKIRVLDRPLWGKHELSVRQAPSYAPNRAFYAGIRYQPPEPDELTAREGEIVSRLIAAAHERGMRCYFQWVQGRPPGLSDEDRPRLPDGRLAKRTLADTASLAAPDVVAYNDALLRDLLEAYPEIDGFRPDWPEYPPYFLEDVLVDFSPHAARAADELGFDFEAMRRGVTELIARLARLTNTTLTEFLSPDGGRFALARRLVERPTILDWLRFKAALSRQTLARMRKTIDEASQAPKLLEANAFAPPFSVLSGLDFAGAADDCDAFCPKLYAMHWSLMVKLYADQLLEWSPSLDEGLLTRLLVRLLDLADEDGDYHMSQYGYPAPDQPHPVGPGPQRRKIAQVKAAIAGRAKVHALVHSYGPTENFRERFELAITSEADGIWINRYGYLSDEKLAVVAAKKP